ncbi:nuclear transport factor 2 family protein [Pedobacter sp. UBA5917]|jgi:hypothetical protein|uniref:nuclear transport factor 2 family protein n=1 Tax=Pedobacter sp. UBA5917 TaxID=1947061 RepID=UPI0025CF4C4A|nr:nuclear transport factor 2 family protein [Pedobacter sp. UBA5917]
MNNYKALIRKAFKAVVENPIYDQTSIGQYFSPEYRQYVDGEELDFDGFCQHMKAQKLSVKHAVIDFQTMVEEGEIVFTNHSVEILTNENRHALMHVIAEFRIKNNRIIYCNELTRLVSGDERERDLGSRL